MPNENKTQTATSMAAISVIIPSYNCGQYIVGALESVFAQSCQNFEVIVVDDGSNDDTAEVLRPYLDRRNFRYVYQQNRGLPGARNCGARLSHAEYLAFLDADDALAPNALERMKTVLDRSGASWCLVDILKVNGERRQVQRTMLPSGDLLHGILREDFIRRGMFFRRQQFFDVGLYDESMRYREDWEINIRMFEADQPFIYLAEPLYLYSWREGSITTGNRAKVLDYSTQVLRKHHKRLADRGDHDAAKLYASNLWDLARQYFYELHDYRRALACVRESVVYDPSLVRVFHPVVHNFRRLIGRVPA
jgi:glycosyltransferase involved in cell wall biosynthesis